MAGNLGKQVNKVSRETMISKAMANLATYTVSDRKMVSTLTATMSRLTADLTTTSTQLVTTLAFNATLTSAISKMR